jgi:hypothetical protein
MNVVDSSAWLSYFAGDANATVFSAPIEKISELLVPSITIDEGRYFSSLAESSVNSIGSLFVKLKRTA